MCLTPPPLLFVPAAFDAAKEYCTRDIVFFWQPPSCFRSGRLPASRSKAFLFPAANIFSLRKRATSTKTTRRYLQHITRLSDLRLHKQYGREVRNFDIAVWEREREMLYLSALTPSSTKIQSCNHISWTRATDFSRKVAPTTSYEASDTGLAMSLHASRRHGAPKLLGKALQTVRRLFRDRTPSPTCHQLLSPQGASPTVETAPSKLTLLRDSDCVQVARQQRLLRRTTPTLCQTYHRTTEAMSSL